MVYKKRLEELVQELLNHLSGRSAPWRLAPERVTDQLGGEEGCAIIINRCGDKVRLGCK